MDEAVEAARAHGASATTSSCPTSSPTRPTRRSTGARPARRSWRRSTGGSTCSSPGVGTGGTITGVGEVLQERNPSCRVVAVEPRGSAVLSGEPPGPHRIQGIGAGFVPAGAQPRAARRGDRRSTTRTRSRPPASCARREGVLAGISCGAALWAALEVAARPESRGKRIVVILPDSGERYVSHAVLRALSRAPVSVRCRRYALSMLGLGTLRPGASASCAATSPPRASATRRRAASGTPEILATWPGVHALLAHRVAHALHEAGVPLAAARCSSMATRALTGIEIHPAARDRRRPLHRPRHGRRDRRDGRDRRRRDALPGRHARRHRLRDRQAPPDGAGQRDDRLGREAARADHDRPRREDRRQQRRHPRRAAELDRGRQPRPPGARRGPPRRGPRRRLDPPARPDRRRDRRAWPAASARSSARWRSWRARSGSRPGRGPPAAAGAAGRTRPAASGASM